MTYRNVVAVFEERVRSHPERPHLRFNRDGRWQEWSYGEVGRRVEAVAAGLASLGLGPGDTVSIFSENRPEWAIADFGSIGAGVAVATIYATLPADEAGYIVHHSDSRVVFAGDGSQVEKLLAIRDQLPNLQKIVVLEGEAPARDDVLTLDALQALGQSGAHRSRLHEMAEQLGPDDPLAISYTSGTTGVPKGAVLTHGNVIRTMEMTIQAIPVLPDYDLNLSFLPLAHVLERFCGHLAPLYLGGTVAYARSIETIADDFQSVRPKFAIVVPRVLEKIHARVESQVAEGPALRRAIFRWAIGVGTRCSMSKERHQGIPAFLELQRRIADRLVFAKIRARMGGRVQILPCGGAPLSEHVARFFHAIGVLACEGWGLTETCAPATINTPDDYRFGSVGRALPGVEVKIADDGELLVRGPNVFRGYFKDEHATADVFDPDGFFRTGDIGRVDQEGFFYITDRKKELIVTSGGKNVAPQKIENMLRESRLISSAYVHGDRRQYLVALVTVDRAAIKAIHPELADRAADDPSLRTVLEREMQHVNSRLARVEQIKDFRVVDGDFSPEGGELTVTLKLKRRVVARNYEQLLDAMYHE